MKRLSINNKAARAVFKENNMSKVVKRSEADEKYMWNMKDMYENDGLWEDDVKEAESLINGMPAYIEVMDESPRSFFRFLNMIRRYQRSLKKYMYMPIRNRMRIWERANIRIWREELRTLW